MGGRVRVAASADVPGTVPGEVAPEQGLGLHRGAGQESSTCKGPEVALHTQVTLPEARGKCFILKTMTCDNA